MGSSYIHITSILNTQIAVLRKIAFAVPVEAKSRQQRLSIESTSLTRGSSFFIPPFKTLLVPTNQQQKEQREYPKDRRLAVHGIEPRL